MHEQTAAHLILALGLYSSSTARVKRTGRECVVTTEVTILVETYNQRTLTRIEAFDGLEVSHGGNTITRRRALGAVWT